MPRTDPIQVHATVSLDKQTIAEIAAQNKPSQTTQESIRNATWAAFYAVVVYAVVTALMWCAMIQQNKTASKALRQSTESFRMDERAWIELEPIKPALIFKGNALISTAFICNVVPKNVGKTVARDITVKADPVMAADGWDENPQSMRMNQDEELLDKFKWSGTNNPVIVPANPMPKVLAPNSVSPVPFTLTCQAPETLKGGHQWINYLVGRLDYCDQFHVKHWLKFCFYVADSRGEIGACKQGNDEDRNEETETAQTSCGKPN
jgi:hypothetical protein